ncbi:transcriptional regulator [Psychromonas sp. CNPT3]|uniref:LysR family transcriptional regulator n=1 Tax=Psychromonas sp. CNPT3 TaxID=314282 RepID=UPI00006E4831|nr:LysR family transcriptional regulator [Psychromonas sp. CNPT3]AGH81252.1 transcriptional regulator [Psychromonas sp. CNPT3]
MGFDLNTLTIFTQVVNCNSFTKAAINLGITKSTVSRKIAELEDHLGARLLTRSTRNLTLTKEGINFYQSTSQILDRIDQAEIDVMESHDFIRGTMSIVIPVEAENSLMRECITDFMKIHPELIIKLEISNRKVDIISEGVDFIIQAGNVEDSSLIARVFYHATRILIASPEYLERNNEPMTLKDLKAPHQQIVLSTMKHGTGGHVLSGLPYRFKVNTLSASLNACVKGLGIAYMSELLCRDLIKEGKLKHLLPNIYAEKVPINFIYPERKLMTKRLRKFLDFTLQRFENENKKEIKSTLLINDSNGLN